MGVFKYADEASEPDYRVPEDSEDTKEVRKQREKEGTKQPAPSEAGTNTYAEGEVSGTEDSSKASAPNVSRGTLSTRP